MTKKTTIGILSAVGISAAAIGAAAAVIALKKSQTSAEPVFDPAIPVDLDGDGTADAVLLDTDGDGVVDTVVTDTDQEGTVNTIITDLDGDGNDEVIITGNPEVLEAAIDADAAEEPAPETTEEEPTPEVAEESLPDESESVTF